MKHSIKATISASIGNMVEWYDFFIYGLASTLIFPKLFFPSVDPTVAIIVGFGSYAIAFIFRPIGALLFGHLGDIYGRRRVLSISLLLMGICTVGIGLLPTYAEVGIWAPVFLLSLRCIQGLALGGEWGAAATVAYEHNQPSKRGLAGGMIQVGVPLGILMSLIIFSTVQSWYGDAGVLEWAWRVPFLVSIIMVAIGMYIRLCVPETPEFESSTATKSPIRDSLVNDWRTIIGVALYRTFQNTMFNTLSLYVITFLHHEMHYPKQSAYEAMMFGALVSVLSTMGWAFLSDYINRKVLFYTGCISSMIFVPFLFNGLQTLNFGIIISVYAIAFIFVDMMYAIQASHIPMQFSTSVRLTSSNISYNLGGALAGGLSVLIPVVYAYEHNIYHLCMFLIAIGFVSLLGSLWLRR